MDQIDLANPKSHQHRRDLWMIGLKGRYLVMKANPESISLGGIDI